MTEPQASAWSPPPQQEIQGPPPVQVFVAGPRPQNRLTVLVRAILMIPHAVVLFFLGIAAAVVAFLGWWGALFTGRLPGFAATYLTGYVRWYSRVMAYAVFLTGKYPPFSLDDQPDYPVRIATTRETLNRFAVFFRFILVIPAAFLSSFLSYGAFTVVLVVTWVIALIIGKVPATLHQAYAAVFRYQVRSACYSYLLTPTYPVRGVFGDQRPGEEAPPASGQAEDQQTAPADPATWRLLLTPAAKGLAIGFLVLGVVLAIAYGTFGPRSMTAKSGDVQTAATANRTMQRATVKLMRSMAQVQKSVSKCGQNLKCVTAVDAKSATYFQDYANTVHTTPMPSNAAELSGKVAGAAEVVATDYEEMGRASSPKQYATLAQSGLNRHAPELQSDMGALQKVLSQDSKAPSSAGISLGS